MKTQTKLAILILFSLGILALLFGLYLFSQGQKGALLTELLKNQTLASARLLPPELKVKKGEEFSLDLNIENSPVAANVFSFEVIFPAEDLEFVGLDKTNSIASIWFEGGIGRPGLLTLTAGVPNPGYRGKGRLTVLKFKALQAGNFEVSLGPKSTVYRNQDNKNILSLTQNASISVSE